MTDPFVLFDDQVTGQQRYFTKPLALIEAHSPADIPRAFEKIETALNNGHHIAGYFAYELGLALSPKLQPLLKKRQRENNPLIKIGVFPSPSDTPPAELLYSAAPPNIQLTPEWNEVDYKSRFKRLQNYITAGDCYQVNLTFPMRGETDASAAQIYSGFRQAQPGRYGALISLGGADIISFSPELFFERKGSSISMRPMKGTRPRSGDDDFAIAEAMREEPKSRAENLMIVDLLRNDLSRLSKTGSVKVPELFTLESYPTLYQMTSKITGELRGDVSWLDIFKSLFPCGSVTGAPKIRTMEIIDELENAHRGPYCGAMGFIAPNGNACFNVGIRTAILTDNKLRYNVGSGVVSDSDGADEYRECLLKAQIFTPQAEQFIETLYWDPATGYRNEAGHIERLSKAFGKPVTPPRIIAQSPQRVRWSADQNGEISFEATPYKALTEPLNIAISKYALIPHLQRSDVKTSHRYFYDGERARLQALFPDINEVIFCNADGHLCEGSFTSLFIEKDRKLLTPPLSAGLLPGVLRQKLLDEGTAFETTLTLEDLKTADTIWLGNSLRGVMRAKLIKQTPQ